MTAVLVAEGLGHRYGSRVAVEGVDLELVPGEMVALIGANGAGKTTLLAMLAGALEPTAGTVVRHGRVGWVPQRNALYGRLTVLENLRFFARLEGIADVDAAVAGMLERLGLTERATDPVLRLSGGNRQRVNVGIGLLGDPAVLLLDEPTAALDPLQRERLWTSIRGFVEGGTAVLFSTHHHDESGQLPDRVLEMADGRLR